MVNEEQNNSEYEIKAVGNFSLNLKELWQFRELLYFFSWRDIKVKYKQTFLGFAWAILQPGLMMLIFTYFFGKVLKVPSDGLPYPIFVYSGLMLWNLFSSGLSNSGDSMVQNANIIKKVYFPRLVIPIAAVIVSVFDFCMTFVLYFGLLIYYGTSVNFLLLLVCFASAFLITLFTTIGLGIFLSALNVKYRDFRYALPFFILVLMFMTPIIYPVSSLNTPWAKYLMAINPLSTAVSIARYPLQPNLFIDPVLLLISFTTVVVLVIAGIYTFKKTEAYFADLA